MRRHPLRRVLVVVLTALVLGGVGAAPVLATDPLPPPILPPGVTPPPDDGENEVPPGPTYEITPGSEGTELGPPSDGTPGEDPEPEAEQTAKPGKVAPTKGGKAGSPAVAPDASDPGSAEAAEPLERWWVLGTGALLLYLLVDLGRSVLRFRRPGLHI